MFCREQKIVYQGFSLLTANRDVVQNAAIVELTGTFDITPAQVIFAFARAVGILPLTGTSSAEHMKQDLASVGLALPPSIVEVLESIAG
jgi:diketogulonate reductase-like aldo/keto reductase